MTDPGHARVSNNDPTVVRRPRRRLGSLLRSRLACPLCRRRGLRTVHFRKHTCRFECRRCGLRFSIAPVNVGTALQHHAEVILDGLADREKITLYLPFLTSSSDELRSRQVETLAHLGDLIAHEIEQVAAHSRTSHVQLPDSKEDDQ